MEKDRQWYTWWCSLNRSFSRVVRPGFQGFLREVSARVLRHRGITAGMLKNPDQRARNMKTFIY